MLEYFKESDDNEDMQDWMSDTPPTLDKGKYSLFNENRIDKAFTEIANKNYNYRRTYHLQNIRQLFT